MLNRKYEKLIQILMKEDSPMNAATLSSYMQVSSRSIKSYVHDINELHPNCIISNFEGYYIDKTMGSRILTRNLSNTPQTSKERVVYIINQLIQAPIDAYELSDALYVSMSTLKNEVAKARRMTSKYDLTLVNKNDILSIEGLEVNKRKLVSSILYKESNVNFVDLEAIQNSFKDIDIFYIKDVVIDVFNKNYYFINDYSLTNLVLHITITVDRIRNNNDTAIEETSTNVAQQEYNLAKDICNRLEEYFGIQYNDSEVNELAILLVSRATSLDYHDINKNNIYEYIDKETTALVRELVDSLNTFYYINLNEPEFLIRFALHIKNLLIRSKHERFSKNPLVQEIKSGAPLIYEAAVYISGIIKEETGVTINDDEIAYIAFHIGSTLEAQKELSNKITGILCCPNYYDMDTKLIDSINQHFANKLLIKDISDSLEDIDEESVDLIISTIPSNTIPIRNFIQINMFLTRKDIDRIEEKIKSIKQWKEKKEFEKNINNLLSPDLFEIHTSFNSKEKVIAHMSNKLYTLGYVNKHFKRSIYEREEMSSTAYGNFAIPHAMRMEAYKTGLYIMINKKPIHWGEHYVQIIIMMCFNKLERYLFNQIFDPITIILNNPENINLLSQSQNYEQFIQTLVDCLQV